MAHYDVIVVGGGTMGTAAAWELGKRGRSTLVLEQFQHVHTHGAHGGDSRIIRHAYAEGPDYVPLVFRADDLWMDLEQATGEHIYHRVGGLELSAPGNDHASSARASAEAHGIPFEWLSPAEIRRRFPQFRVGDDWVGGYGARAGFLDVERGLRAMAGVAQAQGVEIRTNTAVTAIDIEAARPTVQVGNEVITCDRLIVTAGAWSSRLLGAAQVPLQVLRKTLFWLEVDECALVSEADMPVYIIGIPGYEFYGFPQWNRPGIKVAVHSGGQPTDPDRVDRSISQAERDEIVMVAKQGLHGITGVVLDATTCLYTSTPDQNFVIDRHPANPNVVIGTGFSGHGFKFTPAIGDLLVQVAHGERETLPLFRINRFTEESPTS
ncbi:MAG TPA: N-methyl-L-tryptophan oxidase [Thermomicrobiales bacterium]|nr:N-methyl-L-tryptophan oxidase [Thermomicrobiales bacterium]